MIFAFALLMSIGNPQDPSERATSEEQLSHGCISGIFSYENGGVYVQGV